MARKRKHEDHANHEAWAIPYGDLITLLLAFFVVMYAISSINEGKFRVLSDSLQAAFRGVPRTLEPVQVGEKTRGSGADIAVSIVQQATIDGQPRQMLEAISLGEQLGKGSRKRPEQDQCRRSGHRAAGARPRGRRNRKGAGAAGRRRHDRGAPRVHLGRGGDPHRHPVRERRRRSVRLAHCRRSTFSPRRSPSIRTRCASKATPTIGPSTRPRSRRTGSCPRRAPRASCICLRRGGVDPARLAVIGLGEFRPAQSNDTVEGRNANRRVLIVILGDDQAPEGAFGDGPRCEQPSRRSRVNPRSPSATPTQSIAHGRGRYHDQRQIPAAASRWHGSCSVLPCRHTPSTP